MRNDIADAIGIDAAGIHSSRVTQNLELVGSLDFGQNFYDEPFTDTNTFHLVPGMEYRVIRNLDIMAELGAGLDERLRTTFPQASPSTSGDLAAM